MSVYEVNDSDGTEGRNPLIHYVHSENIDDHILESALQMAGGNLAPTAVVDLALRPKRTYAYRKMHMDEFEEVLISKGMLHPTSGRTGEKWFSEAIEHSRVFQNKGVNPEDEVVAEFELNKKGYQADVKGNAIEQAGSRRRQPSEGRPYNVTNKEHLIDHPKGKVNVGLKGCENVDKFNEHVISIRKIDPHSVMNKTEALRWLRRNKLHVVVGALGVILDGVSLTLSVIEDGGEFGKSSTITTAEIVGGVLGDVIGGAIGSLLPAIGTTVCAFVGSIIGSLIGHGIAKLFLSLSPVIQPGPGPPILQTDPQSKLHRPPPSHFKDSATSGPPNSAFSTKHQGPPKSKFNTQQSYPKTFYKTK